MSNILAPFGFVPVGTSSGMPNFRIGTYRIDKDNSTAIFKGDAVIPDSNGGSAPNGYILQATAGTAAIAGVFWGCKYLSTAMKRVVWSDFWPGSDAAGDVEAYVIDDPQARFKVQASGSSFYITGTAAEWASSPIGRLAQLNVGTGSTATGLSGMYVDTLGDTATFPFMVLDLVTAPPGANGTDYAANYNHVIVGFNNQMLRSNGAVTGIS